MKKAFLVILVFNIFRLLLIPFLDTLPSSVLNQDFYSLNNSLNNSLPLMSAWLIEIIGYVLGKGAIFVRLVFFIITLFTQWAIYLLIIKIIRPERKYFSFLVICSTFLITIISTSAFSDALLLLFWVLSILTLYNAIFESNTKYWLVSGIFMGLAVLNKLSGIALPVGLFTFLIFSGRYRKILFTLQPYIALTIAGLLSLPVWTGIIEISTIPVQIQQIKIISEFLHINNATHFGFIPFQLILVFPILYIGLWWITLKYFGRIFNKPNQVNPEFWFLLSFFLPAFLGFHLISLFSWVDFLGLIPIYITGMIVLLKLIKKRWMYWSLGFSIIIHLLFFAYLLF